MNVKHIEVGLNSNIGLRRKDNQDSACASHGVYVVCDGMGGGKGGKQATTVHGILSCWGARPRPGAG